MRPLLPLMLLTACQAAPSAPQASTASTLGREPERLTLRVVATLPHDGTAFTEGLFFADGQLYESTGLEGRSDLRRVDLQTGRVLQRVAIPDNRFGEGSIAWGDQIISLTYQDGIGYRWNRRTFQQVGTFRYPGEGWGLTTDGTEIFMSDGTPQLRVLDPESLAEKRRINVTLNGGGVQNINELEWVDGQILANIWQTSQIVRIDPATGQVNAIIDARALVQQNRGHGEDVLNGIAYDAASRRLYITGKNWRNMYQVELVPGPAVAAR